MTLLRPACMVLILCLQNGAASGEVRIAALGTSLTQRGDWTESLARTLTSCLAHTVAVARHAAAGRDSGWGVAQLGRIISQQPSVVLIEFAINDADVLDGVSLATSRKNHEEMIERLREANPAVVIFLVTTNPVHGPRGWVRPFLAEYYELYRAIARDNAVGLIDLYPVWARSLAEGDPDRLIPDGLHPTAAAFRRIALPILRHRLSSALGAPSGCS